MEFFVVILLVLVLILLVPYLLRGIGIPSVIAVLIAGIFVGPHGFNLIELIMESLHSGDTVDNVYFTLTAMGTIGMIFLMSLAGLEISPKILHKERKSIVVFASLSISIPALTGLGIAWYFGMPIEGMLLFASVFIGHSVAVVFAIMKEMKLIATRFGIIILGTSLCTDIAGLLLLAYAVHLKSGGSAQESPISLLQFIPFIDNLFFFTFVFIVVVGFYIFGSILITDKITHRLFARMKSHEARKLTLLIVLIFGIVFLGMLIGLHVIIGAFVAGLAIADSLAMKEDERLLHKKMDALGYGIFVPIFFFVVGMNTNLGMLFESWDNFFLVMLTVGGAVCAKLLSGFISLKILKFNSEQAVTGGILTIPLLSASLAGASVGHEVGILTDEYFTAIVLMAVLTTIPGPIIAKNFVHRMKIHFPAGHSDIDKYVYTVEPEEKKDDFLYEVMYETDADGETYSMVYQMDEIPEEGLEPQLLEREAFDMMDVFQDEIDEEEHLTDEEIKQHKKVKHKGH